MDSPAKDLAAKVGPRSVREPDRWDLGRKRQTSQGILDRWRRWGLAEKRGLAFFGSLPLHFG